VKASVSGGARQSAEPGYSGRVSGAQPSKTSLLLSEAVGFTGVSSGPLKTILE
jgi:hypothetical protein